MQRQKVRAIDTHIGRRLRALRTQRGLSLEAVAEIIEVTQQQMSRYELGKQKLTADQLFRLGRGLDVPIAWFFQAFEEDPQELQRLQVALHEECSAYLAATDKDKEQAMLSAWRALPTPVQRERVLAMLEAFGFGI